MKKIINIEGMSCEHCKSRVENALKALEGADSVKVNLKNKTAAVSMKTEVSDSILEDTITELGFEPVKIELKKGLFGK